MRLFLLLAALFSALTVVSAQEYPQATKPNKIRARIEDYVKRRTTGSGFLPNDVRSKAIDKIRLMERSKTAAAVQESQPTWVPVGPFAVGGRIKTIVFHPTIQGTMLIGAASGGVWKTTDYGKNWRPTMDDANAIAMGSLCYDPEDPNIVYAGTGEQVSNNSTIYLSAGLMRSTDAGETWSTFALTQVGSFSKVYVHPKNRDLIMTSCMNSNAGVYKSTDRGATWAKLVEGTVNDMSMNPDNEDEWMISVPGTGIQYTSDGGVTWETRMNGIFGTIGRISVQMSPADPTMVYALVELNSLANIFVSTNKGQSWSNRYSDPQGCFFSGLCDPAGSQGFYDNHVAAHPTDKNFCVVGGIDIWRTTNGGVTWDPSTSGYLNANENVHVDQHCAAYDPFDANTVVAGNDGGMVLSNNRGLMGSWKNINTNLQVSQFYGFDIDLSAKQRNFGGTQDNGTLGSIGGTDWERVAGGDGMITIVDQVNPNIVFGETPYGNMYRIDFGANQIRSIISGLDMNEQALWSAPFIMHPEDNRLLFAGRSRLYISFDAGDLWSPITEPFMNPISAIEVSRARSSNIWLGTAGGELYVSENDGDAFYDASSPNVPRRWVTDFASSPTKENTCFVALGGYGSINLMKTTDLGKTWESRWEGMPDVSCNTVVLHPDDENIIFIGTDAGVFASFDDGRTWMPFGKGLPRVPVLDLKVHPTENVLRAASFGRSVWEVPLPASSVTDPVITSPYGGDRYNGSFNTVISWQGFKPPVTIEYSVNDGATWEPIASGVVGTSTVWKVVNWPTVTGRVRITSESDASQSLISNTFTISITDKGSILQTGSVSHVPYGMAYDGVNGLWTSSYYERKLYKLNATTLRVEKSVELPANVGDSLFTDIAYDRATGTVYIHKLLSSTGDGGYVIIVDTNGTFIDRYNTQARRYPTGLELVGGKLYAGERDGSRQMYVMKPSNGELLDVQPNACQVFYGPRSLTNDGAGNLYQTCTAFPSAGAALTEAYIIRFSTSALSTETGRLDLVGRDGVINARGIAYDERDGNFWIGDFGGNIYKVAGFDYVAPPVTSVEEERGTPVIEHMLVSPNPTSSSSLVILRGVDHDRSVRIEVTDIMGRSVQELFDGVQTAGDDLALRCVVSSLSDGAYGIRAIVNGAVVATGTVVVAR